MSKHCILYTILLYISALLFAPAVSAQGILGIAGEESVSLGIYIKDLATGEVLLEHNPDLALTPASVMKVVTTASVLSVDGAEARFSTPVVLRGAKGAAGVWNGDVVIKASADPTLESEFFKGSAGFVTDIVNGLKNKGISRITGKIIVSQNLSEPGPNLKWEIEDVAWPYGAGLFGFNWRDNSVKLTPATKALVPEVPGFKVDVRRTTGKNDIVRGIGSNELTVYARQTDNKKWKINVSVPDPSAVFIAELTKALKEAGISVGTKSSAAANAAETILLTHRSPEYGAIMRSLMVRSDNLFAEGMLRALAPGASRTKCIEREKEIWDSRGINTKFTIINDGSGLTRANRLSPRFVADILEWMAASPMAETFCGFFPRAGKDGTMRGFLADSPLSGSIALKTGSVSSVQCYAGYKLDAENFPSHIIVIFVNGFFGERKEVRQAAENLLLTIFEQTSED